MQREILPFESANKVEIKAEMRFCEHEPIRPYDI